MTNKATIRKLLLLLGFILITYWAFKPNQPIKSSRGAVVKLESIAPTNDSIGISNILINLDNKRINRVNQRRNPRLLKQYPQIFAQDGVFKPLLNIEAQGPLNIEIKGDGPTGKILFHIPKGAYNAHVYPKYIEDKLFTGKAGEIEKIKISQWKPRGPKLHVDTITAQWSGPNDLFLSTKNLTDIASLTKEFLKETEKIHTSSIENLYKNISEGLKKDEIRYETDLPYIDGDERGWQLIRSPSQIELQKSANCIDIAILVAIQAINNGFSPYIWANSGHALCAVSYSNRDATSAIPFEGTDYLKAPLKPPTKPGEAPREYLPEEEIVYPERQAPRGEEPPKEKIFSMDYNFWEKLYRTNPN